MGTSMSTEPAQVPAASSGTNPTGLLRRRSSGLAYLAGMELPEFDESSRAPTMTVGPDEYDCYGLSAHHRAAAVPLGPYGPYNPAPWILQPRATVETPQPPPDEPDAFEGRQVVMVSGKHKGKLAFVERKVKKKYRLQVEGVPYGLEFYSRSFALVSQPVINQ